MSNKEEQTRRAWVVSQAIANVQLEHLAVSTEVENGLNEFVNGKMSLSELDKRTQKRYGTKR